MAPASADSLTRAARLAVAAGIVIGLSACGREDAPEHTADPDRSPTSRLEFIAGADEVCLERAQALDSAAADAYTALERAARRLDDQGRRLRLSDAYNGISLQITLLTGDLRDLTAPKSERPDLEHYIGLLARSTGWLSYAARDLVTIEPGNEERARAYMVEFAQRMRRASAAARELGLEVCARLDARPPPGTDLV